MTDSGDTDVHELDSRTIERIAAGEVVERPASAVKELVENSLDADPSRVTVAVEADGTEGIRVTDDGVGMDEATVRRAVEKHTTSKITDIEDLERGVSTLGFRGEALHAIAAVSRMTITTRPRDGGPGTELTVEGGEVTDVLSAGCPTGTTVEVQDLFYNVPARRKYLKQESTEFAHVNTVVTSYALANPDVAVTLEHDGRETFATTGQDNLTETILSVYGRDVAQAMISVAGSELVEGPLDGISGLVSHPETNRASRDYLTTFINGRYVTAGAIREAVVEAYDTQLAPDRYPFAVLFLDVDPSTVDVNVHPRKLEVRFADEVGVREQVRTAVEQSLLDAGLVRSSAPRGRSAAEQTEIQPDVADSAARENGPTDSSATDTTAAETTSETSSKHRADTDRSQPSRLSTHGDQTDPSVSSHTGAADSSTGSESHERSDRKETPVRDRGSTQSSAPSSERPERDTERKFDAPVHQQRLGPDEPDVSFDRLPSMRILGQFRDTYVAGETEDGLVLIDQHAADERINYERLREAFAGETTTQALADPVSLELTAREASLFEAHEEALARLGFHANRIDDRTVEVTTLPALVAESAGPELVRDVLMEFPDGELSAAETVDQVVDELLGDLACYPSVTGNTSLTEGSIVELLTALDECDNPYACPHGRPVIVEFDDEEIEARFERDYPGHQ